jgi:hypothetical protein
MAPTQLHLPLVQWTIQNCNLSVIFKLPEQSYVVNRGFSDYDPEHRNLLLRRSGGYGLEDRGIGLSFAPGARDFFFSASTPAVGPTQSSVQWVMGAISPGCKADHLPPSTAEVNTACRFTSIAPYVFMTCCLIKG